MVDADTQSRLVRAAAPVIDDLAEQLADAEVGLLLADRQQQIVLRRFSALAVGRALDSVAAVPGAVYSEQYSGTNAIATVFETGRGEFVVGEEHYLDRLQRFRCYGHPIRHPITGTLEGVLDITGIAQDSQGVLRALVVTATRAIEGQLLLSSPTSHVRLLAAYQARAARSRHVVLGIGHDIVLANGRASAWVGESAAAELRELCRLGPEDKNREWTTTVSTDIDEAPAEARLIPVDGAPGSFVVEIFVMGALPIPRGGSAVAPPARESGNSRRLSPLEAAEVQLISESMERHKGNKSHVAEELGMGRSTLYRRMRTLGLRY
ncbi:hypothetical protein ASE01_17050 [Nocardioides sp. Root190]|nr:hypothetical protein ASE01_17050 [Nocardioides sp. Root190]